MEPVARHSLERHTGPYEGWPSRSRLVIDGVTTGHRVEGYVIEAQYRTAHGVLLVTSYDCPYEEANSFTLLDDGYRPLARQRLAAPYGSYLLHAHWPIDALALALHYSPDLFYLLRVVPRGGWLARRPRLALERCDAWREDARMRASYERLQGELAGIGTALAASAR